MVNALTMPGNQTTPRISVALLFPFLDLSVIFVVITTAVVNLYSNVVF